MAGFDSPAFSIFSWKGANFSMVARLSALQDTEQGTNAEAWSCQSGLSSSHCCNANFVPGVQSRERRRRQIPAPGRPSLSSSTPDAPLREKGVGYPRPAGLGIPSGWVSPYVVPTCKFRLLLLSLGKARGW